MTLAELLANGADEKLEELALILSPEINHVFRQIQSHLGQRQFQVLPVELKDGTFLIRADVLREIGPGGLFMKGFDAIPRGLLSQVEVVPWAQAVPLLQRLPEDLDESDYAEGPDESDHEH